MRIAYFVHDLTDAAVHRRLRMFAAGGASVTPIGFRRSPLPVRSAEGLEAIDLGPTADGKLVRRTLSVASAFAKLERLSKHVRGADAIVARNLEMLVLAAQARKLHAPAAPLTYECLDIHGLLLADRLAGKLLRRLEWNLCRDVDLLLTSSPAFVRHYFAPRRIACPIRLVENKVLELDRPFGELSWPARALPEPPWRIGWFGVIRCRRSLEILAALTRAAGGAVEVIIRGRPSGATFSDLAAAIAAEPYIRYEGPYRSPDDLARIYAEVHFSWAVDYYEKGVNSAWLLPNRIYEGSVHGAVPIALAEVETGRWLAKRNAGVVLSEPIDRMLADFFRRLDRAAYARLSAAIRALPRADLVSDRADCRALIEAIGSAGGYGKPQRRHEIPAPPETSLTHSRQLP